MNSARIPFPPLYGPSYEHDGCGTGFVTNVNGDRTHRIVNLAVQAVVNPTQRGAVPAVAALGDRTSVMVGRAVGHPGVRGGAR